MKSDGFLKQAVAVFIVALAIYIVSYRAIEDRRTRKGPWEIAFNTNAGSAPALSIHQPRLGITNVQILFPGELATNAPGLLALEQPRAVPFAVPFGRCVFMDATSLPGTIVLELFGHEIQLLPRVLTIDKKEQAWNSNSRFVLERISNSPTKP